MNSALITPLIAPLVAILCFDLLFVCFEYLGSKVKILRLRRMSDHIVEIDDTTCYIDHAKERYLPNLISFEDVSAGDTTWLAASYRISRVEVHSKNAGLSGEQPCIRFTMKQYDDESALDLECYSIQEVAVAFVYVHRKLYLLQKDKSVYAPTRTLDKAACNASKTSGLFTYEPAQFLISDDADKGPKLRVADILKTSCKKTSDTVSLMGYYLIEDSSFYAKNKNSMVRLSSKRRVMEKQVDKLDISNLLKRHIINCVGIIMK